MVPNFVPSVVHQPEHPHKSPTTGKRKRKELGARGALRQNQKQGQETRPQYERIVRRLLEMNDSGGTGTLSPHTNILYTLLYLLINVLKWSTMVIY